MPLLVPRRHWTSSLQVRRQTVAWATESTRQQRSTWQQQRQKHPHREYTSGSSSSAVLSNTTSFLRNLHNGAEIFLVGTAHVSKESAREVRDMIRTVKPGTVMVELCPQRAARMRSGGTSNEDFLKQMLGMLFLPGSSLGQGLVRVSLPLMYRGLKLLGMDPGAEFAVALEEADRIGARVVYGDRDVQATLGRLAESVDLSGLLRMMSGAGAPQPPSELTHFFMQAGGGSLEDKVEAMKSRAVVRQMGDYMRQVNPQLATALIDERDAYMVDQLSRLEGRVVAVVGLAHLDGIERRWEQLMYKPRQVAAR